MTDDDATRCSGACCRCFSLPHSPAELWDNYDRWANGVEEPPPGQTGILIDIHILAPMVMYVGTRPPDWAGFSHADPGYYYTCKHFSAATGDCTIYERRPQVCRDFPYGRPCEFKGCTWETGKAGNHPPNTKFSEYTAPQGAAQ